LFCFYQFVSEKNLKEQAPLQFGLSFDQVKFKELEDNIKKIQKKEWLASTSFERYVLLCYY